MKGRKDFYTGNYQMLFIEIKEDLNKWRNTSCLWIERLNIVKQLIFLKLIHYVNAVIIKIKVDSKVHIEIQKNNNHNNFGGKMTFED